MTIVNEENKRIVKSGFEKNEHQGHIVWCTIGGRGQANNCFGVNFFSIKSYNTTWVSRILNDPTLDYACRWCGTKGQFDSIMFMNGELTSDFYTEFKEGKIDDCVSYISMFLKTNGYRVNKKSLKAVMNELLVYEESLDDD